MPSTPVTRKINVLTGADEDEVTVDNIEDTPWSENPFSKEDFEIRAGVQPDNSQDVLWHGTYGITTKQFYEPAVIGTDATYAVKGEEVKVNILQNDANNNVLIEHADTDVGKWLPTGNLHILEKYSFQNKNIDTTTPPVDTNDLVSVQYLQSQAKFRVTFQYYLTYWSLAYFLNNPHLMAER